jgi:hypothetical protein
MSIDTYGGGLCASVSFDTAGFGSHCLRVLRHRGVGFTSPLLALLVVAPTQLMGWLVVVGVRTSRQAVVAVVGSPTRSRCCGAPTSVPVRSHALERVSCRWEVDGCGLVHAVRHVVPRLAVSGGEGKGQKIRNETRRKFVVSRIRHVPRGPPTSWVPPALLCHLIPSTSRTGPHPSEEGRGTV